MSPSPPPYGILDVSSWDAAAEEQLGTKPKQWLRDPDGHLWLWKASTTNTVASGEYRNGDDWAERVSTEVFRSLGVEVARTELATLREEPGTISLSVVDPDLETLVHGNELLAEIGVAVSAAHDRTGYTLAAVRTSLMAVDGPDSGTGAFEAFAGYLLGDALVGNTDRHQENWAAIENAAGQRRLAPSFDHASSLGFLLDDGRRTQMLSTSDANQTPEAWAMRARSRFEGHPPPVEVAIEALNLVARNAADDWKVVIEQLDIAGIIARVPSERMSEPARSFAIRVADSNRSRILSYLLRTMEP